MEAVLIRAPNQVNIDIRAEPEIRPAEVLIKVRSVGLCGTDLHIYLGEYMARYPLVPGHEFAGVIVQVGSKVTDLHVGDRVVADPNVPCNTCYFCQRNQQNHCDNWQGVGITRDGAFATYVAVPAENVFRIGDLSFDEGAMVEPLACVVYGLQRADIALGDDVLIVGAGPIGLLHLQAARHGGAARVVVSDINRSRLKLAEDLGGIPVHADSNQVSVLSRLAARGFDLVIDATGIPTIVENSLRYLKRGGKLLVFGVSPPDATVRLNPFELFQRDLTILGSFALNKTFPRAIELLQNGVIETKSLISERLPLKAFPQTIERFHHGKTAMKVLFHLD